MFGEDSNSSEPVTIEGSSAVALHSEDSNSGDPRGVVRQRHSTAQGGSVAPWRCSSASPLRHGRGKIEKGGEKEEKTLTSRLGPQFLRYFFTKGVFSSRQNWKFG